MIDNKTIREVVINKALLPCIPVEEVTRNASGSGSDDRATFSCNLVKPLVSLEFTLLPTQEGSGDPSPENPRPIIGESEIKFFNRYGSPTSHTISLGQTVYGGDVDVVGGEVTSAFEMVQVKTLNWTEQSNYNRLFTSDLQGLIDTTKLCVCEFAKGYPFNAWASIPVNTISIASSGNVFFKTTDYTDTETFLSDLGDYYICYPLATPTTAQITPVSVSTNKGTNEMWTRGDIPFELSYKYMEGDSCELAKQFSPIFYKKGAIYK